MSRKPQRNIFSHNKPRGISLIVFTLLALIFKSVDYFTPYLSPLSYGIQYVVEPIRLVSDFPQRSINNFDNWFMSRQHLRENNKKLSEENANLKVQMLKTLNIKRENQRLREALGSSAALSDELFLAEILNVKMSQTSQEVIVNKGDSHQVHENQPVLDSLGLMGQVVEVWPTQSRVMLISDEQSEVPVEVVRNGVRGVLKGDGIVNRLLLLYIPVEADVVQGDLLITSGLGQRFPKGYPVGKVESVRRSSNGAFAQVVVTPSALLNQTNYVLLVEKQKTATELLDESAEPVEDDEQEVK